jgi:pre-peptidase
MIREFVAAAREFVAAVLMLPVAGCSFVLDFSDKAIPRDAQIDAPYTQAECDRGEPNNTAATATAITPADTGSAAICAGDVADLDFYRLTVPASTAKVEIRISTTYRKDGDLDLRLYDRTGVTVLSQSTGFGNDEVITCAAGSPMCAALAAGDYVFEVFPAIAGAVNAYTIAITLTP